MAGISSLINLFENGCSSVLPVQQRNINRTTETISPQGAEQSTMNIQNLTEQDNYQRTAFHRAAKYESLQSLLSLLDSVRDADKLCEILQLQDLEGRTALHYAVSNSPQHVMGILNSVRQCNRDKTTQFLKTESTNGESVFDVATNYAGTLHLLLGFIERTDADYHCEITMLYNIQGSPNSQQTAEDSFSLLAEQDGYQQTALHRTAKNEGVETLKNLCSIVTNLEEVYNLLCLQDSEGKTALHYAVANSLQHVQEILNLIEGYNIYPLLKTSSSYGQTVFHVAATKDTPNLLAYLLKAAEKPDDQQKILNVQDIRGMTALHYAAMSSCHLVDAIWNQCSLQNHQKLQLVSIQDCGGDTPLHLAAQHGTAGSLTSLLTAIDSKDRTTVLQIQNHKPGVCAVHLAAEQNTPNLIQEILLLQDTDTDEGFRVDSLRCSSGNSFLFHVRSDECLEVIRDHFTTDDWLELLFLTNNFGMTCLHMAMCNFFLDVAYFLLKSIDSQNRIKLLSKSDSTGDKPLDFLAPLFTGMPPLLTVKMRTEGLQQTKCATLDKILVLIEEKGRLILTKSSILSLFGKLEKRYTTDHDFQVGRRALLRTMLDRNSTEDQLALAYEIEQHLLLKTNTVGENILIDLDLLQHYQTNARVKICLSTVDVEERAREVETLIKQAPLTVDHIEQILPHGGRYILPYNQSNIKQHALILFNTGHRDGAEDEACNLEEALQMVGCNVKKLEWSETCSLITTIDDTVDPILRTCSVLIVAIMCHGYRGTLCSSDGSELPVNNILNHLSQKLPSRLPMIMLIQACQAEGRTTPSTTHLNDGIKRNTDAANLTQLKLSAQCNTLDPDPARPTQSLSIILRRPHTLLLLSTVTGGLAYRGLFTGAMADQIRTSDGETDIFTMFTRAVDTLSGTDQTPEVRATLGKRLIFPPASENFTA